jgi:hypothetical protein
VNRLGEDVGIAVAADESRLIDFLDRLTELPSPTERRSHEYTRLLGFLRQAMGSPE